MYVLPNIAMCCCEKYRLPLNCWAGNCLDHATLPLLVLLCESRRQSSDCTWMSSICKALSQVSTLTAKGVRNSCSSEATAWKSENRKENCLRSEVNTSSANLSSETYSSSFWISVQHLKCIHGFRWSWDISSASLLSNAFTSLYI